MPLKGISVLRVPLPEENSYLMLAPRWTELGMTGQVVVLALLFLAPLVLVAWLYRRELKRVGGSTAFVLLFVRFLLVGLVGVLIGLQPVVARYGSSQGGRVLVAVDRSSSMDVADPLRESEEKARLARAFSSGARTLPPADVEPWTRSEIARKILSPDGLDLLGRLAHNHQVELVGFHERLWDVSLGRWEDLFRPGSSSRSMTDLGLPLKRALENPGPHQPPIRAVVLLTDGQHNRGRLPLELARELRQRQAPVYSIMVASKKPPADIALREVQAPALIFKDADALIEARIRVTSMPAQEIVVELWRKGKSNRPLQAQMVLHDGGDKAYSTRFSLRLDEIGVHALEVTARPADPASHEITRANNTLPVVVRVTQDRVRVLLVDGEARWEYHFLAGALGRDKAVKVDRVVFVQPRIGRIPEKDLPDQGHPRSSLPEHKDINKGDPLFDYDCVVLGDVSPEQLPLSDRRRLEQYVSEQGGTLVLVAGKRYMPLDYLSGSAEETDPLGKMLPIQQLRGVHARSGFHLGVAPEAHLFPFMQLEPDPEGNQKRWAELATHYWGVTGSARPGATVLAYLEEEKKPVAASSTGADKTQGLIVHQHYGFGRVLFVGLDSTWRWRFKIGDEHHHRFWGQVVRWAAATRTLPAGNRWLRFGSRQTVYRVGEEVDISLRLGQEVTVPTPDVPAEARVVALEPGGKERTAAVVPLVAKANQPRLLQGQARDLSPGRYRIDLNVPDLKRFLEPPAKEQAGALFTILPPDHGEMADLAGNPAFLESLAGESKGKVLKAEDAGSLPDILSRSIDQNERRVDQRLWRDPPLVWFTLGILLTLLSVEWLVRRLAGLP
jgi:hypothetical protein